MDKKRILWINQLRGISIFLVVLGHCALTKDKISLIYSFHMPLFFIISGLTLNNNKMYNISFIDYIKNKIKKFVIPYFWMSFMMYPMWYYAFHFLTYEETTVFQALEGIFYSNNLLSYSSPSNALWFLLALFIADIIYYLIIKVSKKDEFKIFILVILCGILGFLDQDVDRIWHFNVALTGVVFLYFGRCFIEVYKNNRNWFEKSKNVGKYMIILLLLGAGFVSHMYNGRISMTANLFGNSVLLFYITSLCFSTAIILITIKLPSIKLINFIGQNTLLYVGMHLPIIRVFEKLYPDIFKIELNSALLGIFIYLLMALLCWVFNSFFPFVCAKKYNSQNFGTFLAKTMIMFDCIVIPMQAILQSYDVYSQSIEMLIVLSLCVSILLVMITNRYLPVIYSE